jgi:hypothetical protein
MFCSRGLIFNGNRKLFGGTEAVEYRFHVFAPGLVFGGTEGASSHFHVLHSLTYFGRYRGRQVSFSYFALPGLFWAVAREPGPVFMFGAARLTRGGTEDVGSRLHVFCSRNRLRRYRGRRVPFSCFALPYSFLAVPRASGPVYMLCAHRLIFDGTEGVESRFHVLRSRTRFGRYRGRCVPFLCFAHPDLFGAVPRTSNFIFMFCARGLIFDDTKGTGSRFHVLHFGTHFRQYRGCRGLVFMFYAPEHVLGDTGVSGVVSKFCAPDLVWGGTKGVRSRFHVLRSRTHFWRYRGRRGPFSCFAPSDSFWSVSRASGPVFMFCAPGIIFGCTKLTWSRVHVLRTQTFFDGSEDVRSRLHVLRSRTRFWRNRGRRVPFSCFAPPDSFWSVPRASV